MWWREDIKRAKRLSQARVHLVTARTSLCTDQRMSGPPIRAKYTHLKTIWEHTSDTSATVSNSSWRCDLQSKAAELCTIAPSLLFASSQYLSTHFFACPSMSQDHAIVFAWGFSHPGNCSVAVADIRDSNISLFWFIVSSFGLHSRWVHPTYTWSRNDVRSSRWTNSINVFHIGTTFCFRPLILMSSTSTATTAQRLIAWDQLQCLFACLGALQWQWQWQWHTQRSPTSVKWRPGLTGKSVGVMIRRKRIGCAVEACSLAKCAHTYC